MEVTSNNVPAKVEASNGSERPSKKNGKEDKSRRKDDKSVEQVMKALNVLETTEEKLAAMCKKYTEIVDENRKIQLTAKQWEKGLHAVLREKEQLQADHSKAVLTRSRLESLCRELQRQNKQIKEESLLKIREEEEKRKEVSAKFNATLAEITALMTSSNEKTNMLRDENVEITKKFKSICDQNAIQQQQVDKMNTQRKLESELTEARLAKQRLEFAAEKEILLKEKQELYMDIHTLHARVNELEASEASLKGQVSLYADRYDEFQTALTKSNEVFGGFKGEMEKMSKKITRLEKETSTWKSRWEKSHQSFLEVVGEKAKCEGELSVAGRKLAQLEKLCRTLQAERVGLLAQARGATDTCPDANHDECDATSGEPAAPDGRKEVRTMPGEGKAKPSGDAAKEKKDKDNVRVLGGDGPGIDAEADGGDKDFSDEKQDRGDGHMDSNKIAEVKSEEKRDELKVETENKINAATKKDEVAAVVNKGPTPLLNYANVLKRDISETKLSKDLSVVMTTPIVETTVSDLPTKIVDTSKIEIRKPGEVGKDQDEKQRGTKARKQNAITHQANLPGEESNVKSEGTTTSRTGNNAQVSAQPIAVEALKTLETDGQLTCAREGESKLKEAESESKVGDLVDCSRTPLPAVDDQATDAAENETTPVTVSEGSVGAVGEAGNAAQQARPVAVPAKEARRGRKQEKAKKPEKRPTSAGETSDDARLPHPPIPSSAAGPGSSSPDPTCTLPTVSSPAPSSASTSAATSTSPAQLINTTACPPTPPTTPAPSPAPSAATTPSLATTCGPAPSPGPPVPTPSPATTPAQPPPQAGLEGSSLPPPLPGSSPKPESDPGASKQQQAEQPRKEKAVQAKKRKK